MLQQQQQWGASELIGLDTPPGRVLAMAVVIGRRDSKLPTASRDDITHSQITVSAQGRV